MEIAVEIVSQQDTPAQGWCFDLALFEQATGTLLHRCRLSVASCPDEHQALGQALLLALAETDRFSPTAIRFCPENPALQKILVEIIPESEAGWVLELQQRLLKLESWHMGPLPEDMHAAAADQLGEPTDAQTALKTFTQPCMNWMVSCTSASSAPCPAPPDPAALYRFGPDIPGGFCIYAAQVVLDSAMNQPLTDDSRRSVVCPQCGAVLDLQA